MIKEANLFYTKTPEQVLRKLSSTKEGLTREEAHQRLRQYGLNEIPEKKQPPLILLFLKQFNSVFIYILIIAGLISYFFSSLLDVTVIAIIIVINASIGFFQEHKAEKSIKALKKMIIDKAKVYRSSQLLQIQAKFLVPGDIIQLEEGDRIPADARLIEAKNFRTVESSLTGESLPTDKIIKQLHENLPLGDRRNMAWLGTFVASGSAKAVVTATGKNTIIGSLAQQIGEIKRRRSHFRKKTDALALYMGLFAVIGASIVFLVGYFIRGFDFPEMFLFTIASLVSGVPEGLPAILTIVLAIGAFKMSRRNALIRKLSATETIGAINTIITDKTGTLTQNTMTVEKIILPGEAEISVTGSGWNPEGEFIQKNKLIIPLEKPNLSKLLHIAAVCNKATILKRENSHTHYKIIGDPTEASLVVLAEKAGIKKSLVLEKERILDEIPFSPQLKYRASLARLSEKNGEKQIYTIGSPESILDHSSQILKNKKLIPLTSKEKKEIESQVDYLAKKAMRVIALSYKPMNSQAKEISNKEVDELVFVGLVGMKDPPREGVKEAIEKTRKAGIRVIMATGDHKNTAIAIAKEIGLIAQQEKKYPEALTEAELLELEKISSRKFEEAIKTVSVFARLTPEMKLKIASTLQKSGALVAMTGDGVNDAPALKKADIGVSMGVIGTDVARASSEIVLADDNFATIVSAIEEGRIVFINTRQTSAFLAITNMAEHITIITTLLLGMPLPLLPAQILWLNMVADTGTGLGLAAEPDLNHAITEPPRDPKENILTLSMIPFLIIVATVMIVATTLVFSNYLAQGIDKARTAAFAVLVFSQLFNAVNMRSLKKSIFSIGFFSNKYMNIALIASVLLAIAVFYFAPLRALFQFTPLTVIELTSIIALSSLIFWAGEGYKFVRRHTKNRQAQGLKQKVL